MARQESKNSVPDFPVVGIGCSAGGLEAMQKLFQALPDSTGAAFVIIQHLKEDQESHLSRILSKQTAMPVRTIENGMRPEPNTVFVIPPAADVVLGPEGFQV